MHKIFKISFIVILASTFISCLVHPMEQQVKEKKIDIRSLVDITVDAIKNIILNSTDHNINNIIKLCSNLNIDVKEKLKQSLITDKNIYNIIKHEKLLARFDLNIYGTNSHYALTKISKDNKFIFIGYSTGLVKIYDITLGKYLENYLKHNSAIGAIDTTINDKLLFTTSSEIKVWSLNQGTCLYLHTLPEHNDFIECLLVSNNNNIIVIGSWDNTAKVWDINSGQLLQTLSGHTEPIKSIAISRDNEFIVTGSFDSTAKVWDTITGKCLLTLEGHNNYIRSVAISSDSKFIVTGAWDNTAKIWDIATGKCLITLENQNPISSVKISNDNKFIVTNSKPLTGTGWYNNVLNIYDLTTNKCLILEDDHVYYLSIAISDDNKFINAYARRQIHDLTYIYLKKWPILFNKNLEEILDIIKQAKFN